MDTELTARQQDMLDHMVEYCCRMGHPPAIRQLCVMMGIASPNGAMCHMRALILKGAVVQNEKYAGRSYVPVNVLRYLQAMPADLRGFRPPADEILESTEQEGLAS